MNKPALWRKIQKKNFVKWETLAAFLQLDAEARAQILTKTQFPLNLPLRLAEKITKKTLEDPILKQFLPLIQEKTLVPGFTKDPVNDHLFLKRQKILHKYRGRALLICTSACVMNCRFCFRQNFPYENSPRLFDEELKLLADDSSISEIILSGGDPLSLSNEILHKLFADLQQIPHLQRLRIHTRFPIGIPERIDSNFLKLLKSSRFQVYFVVHCNHPKELDVQILSKLKKIQKLGIPVLSQTVLLKEINDESAILKELFGLLVDHGIQPYYLHQLDRVQGAAHFEVDEQKGIQLIKEISKELPGYGVPRYVREIPGRAYKTPIF